MTARNAIAAKRALIGSGLRLQEGDLNLLLCWVALLTVGAIMVPSAAVALQIDYATRHFVFLGIALFAFCVVVCTPLKLVERLHKLAWLGALAGLVLVLLPGIGTETNGALRWVRFGGFSFQPSEFAKVLLVIYFAGYLARFSREVTVDGFAALRPMLMLLPILILLLAEPDFGTTVILAVTCVVLLFIGGVQLRYFFAVGVLGAGAFALLILTQGYRFERLATFQNPWEHAFQGGYQLTQSLIGFGRGELTGLGLGEGIQKLYYLPEAHNDFIFSVIAEEFGLLGVFVMVLLFGALVLQVLQVARRSLESGQVFNGYVCYGVALILGLQFLINLGVNVGALPTKGLTLPFVSYGGNSLIASCVLFGLVVRVALEHNMTQAVSGRGRRR